MFRLAIEAAPKPLAAQGRSYCGSLRLFVDKEKNVEVVFTDADGSPMKLKPVRTVCMLAMIAMCAGCSRRDASAILERHHQFSMAIGKMEDQIDLIQLPGRAFSQTIDIKMKNGLFFLSNGAAKKVMKFSSYGDLLTLFYNAAANPPPVLLAEQKEGNGVSNRKAFAYPFNEVGEIAVTDSGMLYVQDVVAEDRRIWDEELQTQLRNVILRFTPGGAPADYIGQDGVYGVPFPYIDSLTLCAGDILTVVTRTTDAWIIFSYNRFGELRYRFHFTDAALPEPEAGAVLAIDKVMAGPEPDVLYVKTDSYRERSQSGDFGFSKSTIHWIDASIGAVIGETELPPAYTTSGRAQMFNKEQQEVLQYLAGVSEGGVFFLVSPAAEGTYNLLMVNTGGLVVHRGLLALDDSKTLYRRFHVTQEGILTAFIGRNTEAEVVLWRTDRYLSEQK